MVEIIGEVYQKERGHMLRPGIVTPDPRELTHVPVFRLRILTAQGKLMQVLYKGEPPGDADIGEQVIVKGIERGGIIYARSIYNTTTNSWTTSAPGFFRRLLGE